MTNKMMWIIRMREQYKVLCVLVGVFFLGGLVPVANAQEAPLAQSAPAGAYDGGIARAWMARFVDMVAEEGLSPPEASRVYAYGALALYEAVQPGILLNDSLVGQVNGLDALPQPDPALTYDWPLVASSALHTVADGLFSAATPREPMNALFAAQQALRGEDVPFNAFNRSVAFGAELGEAVLAYASADNYALTRDLAYTIPTGDPAYWVPLADQTPMEPHWEILRPFGLTMAESCDVAPAVAYSADPESEFYAQANEVRIVVANLAETESEQATIARFWADDPGLTGTPSGHWVSIQNTLVGQLNLSLEQAAEMYALTNLAMADAFISAWESKYRYQMVRPITVIQSQMDPTWDTVVGTPPFPEYPSGHSVASGAASTVLTHLFGNIAFDDAGLAPGFAPRSFASFNAAAEEAAISRLYGGIHYRFSIDQGLEQGRCVGRQIIERLELGVQ